MPAVSSSEGEKIYQKLRQAQEQMAEIVDYIIFELFAPDAANNLLDKMENSIMALTEFPERNDTRGRSFCHDECPLSRNVFTIYPYCWVGITYRDKSSVPGLNYLVNGFNTLSKII